MLLVAASDPTWVHLAPRPAHAAPCERAQGRAAGADGRLGIYVVMRCPVFFYLRVMNMMNTRCDDLAVCVDSWMGPGLSFP